MKELLTKENITLLGVILSFIASSVGLWIGIHNSRKTIFINSVTASRLKHIQDLRTSIAEFCGLFYRYHLLVENQPGLSKEKFEILNNIDKLKYQIKLYLNPRDVYWDNKIFELIDQIRNSLERYPEEEIEELINITQYLLKLEWEGAKLEVRKGSLSKKKKRNLYKEYVELYRQGNKKFKLVRRLMSR